GRLGQRRGSDRRGRDDLLRRSAGSTLSGHGGRRRLRSGHGPRSRLGGRARRLGGGLGDGRCRVGGSLLLGSSGLWRYRSGSLPGLLRLLSMGHLSLGLLCLLGGSLLILRLLCLSRGLRRRFLLTLCRSCRGLLGFGDRSCFVGLL